MSSSRKHHLKVKGHTPGEQVIRPSGPIRFKEGREELAVFSFCCKCLKNLFEWRQNWDRKLLKRKYVKIDLADAVCLLSCRV